MLLKKRLNTSCLIWMDAKQVKRMTENHRDEWQERQWASLVEKGQSGLRVGSCKNLSWRRVQEGLLRLVKAGERGQEIMGKDTRCALNVCKGRQMKVQKKSITQLEQEVDSKVEDLTDRKINVHKTNQAAKEQAKAKKQYRIQNPCNL